MLASPEPIANLFSTCKQARDMDDVAGQSAAAEASTTSMDAEPSNDVAGPSTTEAVDGGHVDGRILPRLVNGWARHPAVLERYYTSHCVEQSPVRTCALQRRLRSGRLSVTPDASQG